jgi:hypothetical protein
MSASTTPAGQNSLSKPQVVEKAWETVALAFVRGFDVRGDQPTATAADRSPRIIARFPHFVQKAEARPDDFRGEDGKIAPGYAMVARLLPPGRRCRVSPSRRP